MKKLVLVVLALAVVGGFAAAAYFMGWLGPRTAGVAPAAEQAGRGAAAPSGTTPGTPAAPAEPAQPAAPSEDTTTASTPAEPPPAFDGNVAALQFGGTLERVSGWDPRDPRVPVVLIDGDTSHRYWRSEEGEPGPKEIVVSFFNRAAVLVDRVVLAAGDEQPETPRDVEVWVSATSPTEGFARVAAATLSFDNDDKEATVAFSPVQAKYVQLRLLTTRGGEQFYLTEVRVMEAAQAGYTPLLTREAELARLTGHAPAQAAALSPVSASKAEPVCSPEATLTAIRSGKGESRRVLVIDVAGRGNYPPADDPEPDDTGRLDTSILKRVRFTTVRPEDASPAFLAASLGYDTVVMAQVCDPVADIPATFLKALPSWVAEGHKLIIHDSDRCREGPDYSFLPFRFATNNPGALGASGSDLRLLEDNAIAHSRRTLAGFVDIDAWVGGENDYYNELGDSNTVTRWDPNWCGHMAVRNVNGVFGFSETYAHLGRGLIIYNGFDLDQWSSVGYRLLALRELALGFDPDNLPCSARLGDFILSTDSGLVRRPIVAGRTYVYPLALLSNQGYKGRISLSLAATPGLNGLKAAFEPASVTLANVAESRLTVEVPAGVKAAPQALMVKGVDDAGKSNSLCLQLVEPETGELSVVSMLQRAKAPTKNLEIILDVSGSMSTALGKKTRWTTALDVLRDVLARLPSDFRVGLRLYGHRESSRSPKTCTDTELVVPIDELDREAILRAATAVKPRGETPLVYSVLQAPADLKEAGGGTVILITDGEESCKGNMATAAAELKAADQEVILNIVGFTLTGQKARATLSAFAESTGGRFYAASTGEGLAQALLIAAVDKFPYEVFDGAGRLVASGEAGGAPEALPPGTYRVVVKAGEQSIAADGVQVALGRESTVRIVLSKDRLALEK